MYRADSKRDEHISRHVMSTHSKVFSQTPGLNAKRGFYSSNQSSENLDYLPEPLFKTYISYAKKYCNPKVDIKYSLFVRRRKKLTGTYRLSLSESESADRSLKKQGLL